MSAFSSQPNTNLEGPDGPGVSHFEPSPRNHQQSRGRAANSEQLTSYTNALVILPPANIQTRINSLRVANDKSFPRWTAHVTLIFPFVRDESLTKVMATLRTAVTNANLAPFDVSFDQVGRFKQHKYDTVYLTTSSCGLSQIQHLWTVLAESLSYKGRPFVPHLTLGQTQRSDTFLEGKGEALLRRGDLQWTVDSVTLLQKDEKDGGRMKIIDKIPLSGITSTFQSRIVPEFPCTYHFDLTEQSWVPLHNVTDLPPSKANDLAVLTLNVLHDPSHPFGTRFDRIKSIFQSQDPDILCLQEVSDDFLDLLLGDQDVRATWRWSTRGPNTVMENERNVVVMTKEYLPLSWKRLALGGKHKAAVLTSIRVLHPRTLDSIQVQVAAAHLTAGLSPAQIEVKAHEFQTLVTTLHERHPVDEWIIVGDMNFPSAFQPEPDSEPLTDVWLWHHPSNAMAYSASYDPSRNSLASSTARLDRSPQRYDRIYVKANGKLHCSQVKVLDESADDGAASDHWPLVATLTLLSSSFNGPSPRSEHESILMSTLCPHSISDSDLHAFAQLSGALPDQVQQGHKDKAISTLCNVLQAARGGVDGVDDTLLQTSTRAAVRVILVPVGSFALGVDFPDSDVDCIAIGNVSEATFWALSKERLKAQQSPNKNLADDQVVSLKRFVRDAAVQMMVLECAGVKFDLQYLVGPELIERWSDLSHSSEAVQIALSAPSLRKLNAHRDRLWLMEHIPSLPHFQLAHRSIKLFCQNHGIYGARYGYLGGIHISILLVNICISQSHDTAASDLVYQFFMTYSTFDWSRDALTISNRDAAYQRKPREPMVIRSPRKPTRNVAAGATVPSLQTVVHEFKAACRQLRESVTWSDICGTEGVNAQAFTRAYQSYIKIDVAYWGRSGMRARALLGFTESRIPHLLVELHACRPSSTFRFWPSRFANSSSTSQSKNNEGGCEVDGFYLIGIADEEQGQGPGALRPLFSVLQAFEMDIRKHERYYDPSNSFVALTEVGGVTLPDLISIDDLVWDDNGIDVGDEDAGSADEFDAAVDEPSDADHDAFRHLSNKQLKKQRERAKPNSAPANTSKLRTSADVYNRLLWDSSVDQDDYMIGYEDRFLGTKEIKLKLWKREVEDEAFIPFHRVIYFRRMTDDSLVWDRRTRIDLIFNSGVSQTIK